MSLLDALLEDSLLLSADRDLKAREVWFAFRSDGSGTGTQDDPYDGSDRDRFDALLSGLPENVVIHLGPGVFKTRGGRGNKRPFAPWLLRNGQKIIGAGMSVTTLKLELIAADVDGVALDTACAGIGSNTPMTSYEISDLTIDCNMDGQPASTGYAYARVMCQGIILKGTGFSVRRVRVINWGTRTFDQECFPLYLQPPSGAPLTNVIEDCIVENPGWNNTRETTCIQGAIQRNNLVRCDLRKPDPYPPLAVESISYADPVVTLVTRQPHQLTTADPIIVSGASLPFSDDVPGQEPMMGRESTVMGGESTVMRRVSTAGVAETSHLAGLPRG